jgi:hypothetical protein
MDPQDAGINAQFHRTCFRGLNLTLLYRNSQINQFLRPGCLLKLLQQC